MHFVAFSLPCAPPAAGHKSAENRRAALFSLPARSTVLSSAVGAALPKTLPGIPSRPIVAAPRERQPLQPRTPATLTFQVGIYGANRCSGRPWRGCCPQPPAAACPTATLSLPLRPAAGRSPVHGPRGWRSHGPF